MSLFYIDQNIWNAMKERRKNVSQYETWPSGLNSLKIAAWTIFGRYPILDTEFFLFPQVCRYLFHISGFAEAVCSFLSQCAFVSYVYIVTVINCEYRYTVLHPCDVLRNMDTINAFAVQFMVYFDSGHSLHISYDTAGSDGVRWKILSFQVWKKNSFLLYIHLRFCLKCIYNHPDFSVKEKKGKKNTYRYNLTKKEYCIIFNTLKEYWILNVSQYTLYLCDVCICVV